MFWAERCGRDAGRGLTRRCRAGVLRARGFEQSSQGVKIAQDLFGIVLEFLIGHAFVLKKGKEYFAAVAIGNDPHRVGEPDAGGQRNRVVEYAEHVVRDKAEHDAPQG